MLTKKSVKGVRQLMDDEIRIMTANVNKLPLNMLMETVRVLQHDDRLGILPQVEVEFLKAAETELYKRDSTKRV